MKSVVAAIIVVWVLCALASFTAYVDRAVRARRLRPMEHSLARAEFKQLRRQLCYMAATLVGLSLFAGLLLHSLIF